MTFQIKHTKQNLFNTSFFKVLILFILIFVFVFVFGVSRSVSSLVINFLSPLFKAGDYFYGTLGKIPNFFSDRNKLAEENAKLLFELQNLRLNIADYESIKYENRQLREDLNIKPKGNFIASSIIAKSPQIPLDSLFLDKGTGDGINNGDLVLAGERTSIGKIAESSKNKATVSLNSFAGAVSYGYVARTDEPLEIKGVGGGDIEAKVSIDFDIEVGDKIMATGSSAYLVAIVGSIEENQSSGFKNVLLFLPINVSRINMVFVVPTINE